MSEFTKMYEENDEKIREIELANYTKEFLKHWFLEDRSRAEKISDSSKVSFNTRVLKYD